MANRQRAELGKHGDTHAQTWQYYNDNDILNKRCDGGQRHWMNSVGHAGFEIAVK